MTLNRHFDHFGYAREQSLVQDLVTEVIGIYGHEVYYLPRTIVNRDDMFVEDPLSKFESAIPIAAYVVDVDGFAGEGDILARIGFQIQDEITFRVSRKTWEEARTPKVTLEEGEVLLLEETDVVRYTNFNARTGSPNENDGAVRLEDGSPDVTESRPNEGDLVYFPLVKKIFEIKFVEHEQIFYQTGALQEYDLRCELWEYSSERLETDVAAIDSRANDRSLDSLANELLADGTITGEEDDDPVLETGDGIDLEDPVIRDVDPEARNRFFDEESRKTLDFSEDSPFV